MRTKLGFKLMKPYAIVVSPTTLVRIRDLTIQPPLPNREHNRPEFLIPFECQGIVW